MLRPSLPPESLILKVIQEEKLKLQILGKGRFWGKGLCVCGGEGSGVAVGHGQGGGSSHKVVPAAPGLQANPGCAPACHSG